MARGAAARIASVPGCLPGQTMQSAAAGATRGRERRGRGVGSCGLDEVGGYTRDVMRNTALLVAVLCVTATVSAQHRFGHARPRPDGSVEQRTRRVHGSMAEVMAPGGEETETR